MGDEFTVYMHFRGTVETSKTGFRKYIGGKITKFSGVDPDKFSKEEVTDLLKDIGIFDVDEVYFTVTGVQFDEGLRHFKTDKDALTICDFAAKTFSIHVYVTHSRAPKVPKNSVGGGGINDDTNVSLGVVDDIEFGLDDSGVQVPLNLVSRLEENLLEEDSDAGEEEVEEYGDGEEEEDIHLPEMYDSDYGDPSGDDLYNVVGENDEQYVASGEGVTSKSGKQNSQPQETPPSQVGKVHNASTLFGEEIEDISDSDGEGPQEWFVDTPDVSEDEGEEIVSKQKSKDIEFRRQTDMDNPKFMPGMIFKDHKEFKEAVTNYKIRNHYNVRVKKQESKRVLYKCVPPCPWKLYASWNKSVGALMVKTFDNVHRCSRAYHSRQVTSRWVAIKMMDKIRRDPHYKVSEIVEDIKEHCEIEISLSKATRGRKLARLMVGGKFEEQYKRVRDYGYELLRSNPGSTVKYDLAIPSRHFKRMYICLAACKKAFLLHCRPVISVDACHLRGPITGKLLSAVGIDANDGMYPIAFAVAEGETKETWTWFFKNLLEDIGSAKDHGWVFYSDQQKGLVPALNSIFPGVRHRLCVRHLYANFKKKYPGLVLKELMEDAAKETTEIGFEKKMAEMKILDWRAEQHLRGIDPQLWCKHTFVSYPKCDMLLNNLAECFNSKIIKARDKPVIPCMETIRRYIMTRIHRNRDAMAKYHGPICPRIQGKLEKNKKESLKWTSEWNGLDKYGVSRGRQVFVVNLKTRSCKCNKWDITGIPCEHACAAIFKNNELCEDYVDVYLSKETFLRTYSVYVEPVNGEDFWPDAGGLPILPPKIRTQPGRPRLNKRKRDVDEPKENSTKLSRKNTKILCSKCGKDGHNKRTCKSDLQSEANNGETNQSEYENAAPTTKVTTNGKNTKTSKVSGIGNLSKQKQGSTSQGHNNTTTTRMGFKIPNDKQKRSSNKQKSGVSSITDFEQGQASGSSVQTHPTPGSQISS